MLGGKSMDNIDNIDIISSYEPKKCSNCGEKMKFKGLGEFVCENCGIQEYNDYGKVRNYIEAHRGCNAIEIEAATGVPRKAIHQMLREERIEVTKDSKVFLKCEHCGKDILTGRYCEKCENIIKGFSEKKPERKSSVKGFGKSTASTLDGEIRFKR